MSGIYRIVVVGSGDSNKSAITVRFIQGNFVEKYDPTIEDEYRKLVEIDGKACVLSIMDTAGQEEYSALRDQYMKTAQGFILCYTITKLISFEVANKLRTQILRIKEDCNDIPIMLAGTKCKLEAERQVSTEQAQAFATKIGSGFMEVDAKHNHNIEEVFFELVRMIDKYNKKHNNAALTTTVPTNKKERKYPVKLMILGHSNAGKTTLLEALINRSNKSIFSKQQLTSTDCQSTLSLDTSKNSFGSKSLEYTIFDFAGQIEYLPSHDLFVTTQNSIIMLVIDSTLSLKQQELCFNQWFTFVLKAVPSKEEVKGNIDVIVVTVFTKCKWPSRSSSVEASKVALNNLIDTHYGVKFLNKNIHSGVIHCVDSFNNSGLTNLLKKIKQCGRIIASKVKENEILQTSIELIKQKARLLENVQKFATKAEFTELAKLTDVISLRNMGIIQPCGELFCLEPQLLAKLVGALLCENKHLNMYINAYVEKHGKVDLFKEFIDEVKKYVNVKQRAILSRHEIECRIKLSLLAKPTEDVSHIVNVLPQIGIAIPLSANEQQLYMKHRSSVAYLVPAHRSKGDINILFLAFELQKMFAGFSTFIGRQLSANKASLPFSQFHFNKLQLMLRKQNYQDVNFKIFSNAMVLKSVDNSDNSKAILIWDESSTSINVLVCGNKPKLLMFQIVEQIKIHLKANVEENVICPKHSQHGKFSVIDFVHNKWQCKLGQHECDEEHIQQGFTNITATPLWSFRGDKFTTTGNWQTKSNRLKYLLVNNSKEKHRAFVEEFDFVNRAFYGFIGREKAKNFVLTRVAFLQNDTLEQRFENKFKQFATKVLKQESSEITQTKSPQNQNSNSVADPNEEYKEQWRDELLHRLDNSVVQVSGNEGVNMLLAWHGTSEAACFSIATSNFTNPTPLDTEELEQLQSSETMMKLFAAKKQKNKFFNDLGYYGRGLYFTQHASYGEEYTVKAVNRLSSENEAVIEDNMEYTLLLCYVLMGRVKPVVEHPITDFPNYHGTNCADGYDSHYTIINAAGYPCPLIAASNNNNNNNNNNNSSSNNNNNSYNTNLEPPKGDEIVVFDADQVLPRYIVYYKRVLKNEQHFTILQPEQIASKTVILWVDDNINSAKYVSKSIVNHATTIMHYCTSNAEATVWIKNNIDILLGLNNNGNKFKVVSGASRDIDNCEEAPFNLLHALSLFSFSSRLPFLIFSGDVRFAQLRIKSSSFSSKIKVTASNDINDLSKYILT